MSLALLSYLYFTVSALIKTLLGAVLIPYVGYLFYHFVCWMSDADIKEDSAKAHRKSLGHKPYFFAAVSVLLLSCLIPSKESLQIILGAYALDNIQELDGAKELPQNVVNAINTFLTEAENEK